MQKYPNTQKRKTSRVRHFKIKNFFLQPAADVDKKKLIFYVLVLSEFTTRRSHSVKKELTNFDVILCDNK